MKELRLLRPINPKNHWANQFQSLSNQSNFHEGVRHIFQTDPFFSHLTCYQEVPVQDLIPEYYSKQHRFDWYIEELNIVLELHGEQHYKPTNFGSMSYEQVQREFADGRRRDQLKQEAALEANFKYVSLSYKEINKLTGTYLKSILLESK